MDISLESPVICAYHATYSDVGEPVHNHAPGDICIQRHLEKYDVKDHLKDVTRGFCDSNLNRTAKTYCYHRASIYEWPTSTFQWTIRKPTP